MNFKILETNGIKIRSMIDGEGPLVVLVHGFPESWYSWRNQIPVIAKAGYTVAAIDVRGYGGSDNPYPIDAYSMRNLSLDVIGVIDALKFNDAILIGHDWGAPIVWTTAALNEDKISAVAGLSVPFFPRGKISAIDLFKKIYEGKFFYQLYFQKEGRAESELETNIERFLELFYFSSDARGIKYSIENNLGKNNKDPEATLLDDMPAFKTYPSWITKKELSYFVKEFSENGMRGPLNRYRAQQIDFNELLELSDKKIKQPAGFCTGSLDPVNFFTGTGFKNSEDLREKVGKNYENLISTALLENTGHWTQQESPKEVNNFILDFLSKL